MRVHSATLLYLESRVLTSLSELSLVRHPVGFGGGIRLRGPGLSPTRLHVSECRLARKVTGRSHRGGVAPSSFPCPFTLPPSLGPLYGRMGRWWVLSFPEGSPFVIFLGPFTPRTLRRTRVTTLGCCLAGPPFLVVGVSSVAHPAHFTFKRFAPFLHELTPPHSHEMRMAHGADKSGPLSEACGAPHQASTPGVLHQAFLRRCA